MLLNNLILNIITIVSTNLNCNNNNNNNTVVIIIIIQGHASLYDA